MKKPPKKPPRLKAIDLRRGTESDHPDISSKKQYLAKIGGDWFAGRFTRLWYGWNFDNWISGTVGLQLDKPGTNGSQWQALYEIQTTKATRPKISRRSGS